MTTYYFDAVRGSDSNNGTGMNSAFKSLKALDSIKLKAGDQVLLASGQQFDGQLNLKGGGRADLPVVVSSFGSGDKPIISGGDVGIYASKTSYIDISNIAITNTKGNAFYAGNANNIKLDNIAVYDTGTAKAGSISIQSSQTITITNSRIDGVKGDGIWMENVNGLTIRGNEVTNATGHNADAIQINDSKNILVAGNSLDMSDSNSSKGVLVLVNALDATVENNTIKGGGFGLAAYGENIVIKGNEIFDFGGYSWSYGIGLGQQVDAKNYTITDNHIHDGVWAISVSSPGGSVQVARTGINIQNNLFEVLSSGGLKVDREASVHYEGNSIGASVRDFYVSELVKMTGLVTTVASTLKVPLPSPEVQAQVLTPGTGGAEGSTIAPKVADGPKTAGASVVPAGDKVLTTNGEDFAGTVAEFDAFKFIQGSATDPSAPIDLIVKNGGVLDLGAELAGRGATITGSAAGNTITTGAGNDRMIQTLDALDKGATTIFRGGAGTDTLELSATAGTLKATLLSDGSISFTAGGRTVVAGADVEAFVINGSEGNDILMGSAGNDRLDGRRGSDTYYGSAGDDTYIFNSGGDKVIGEVAGGGIDTIRASVSVNLNNHSAVENLIFDGKNSALNATGNALDNMLVGNKWNNVIAGGTGNDQLYGKGGADTFHFAEMGAANKDTIWDFDADDKIRLDKGVFAGLDANKDGILDAGAFVIGSKAVGGTAQIVYDATTGDISYDADGAGAKAMQVIAQIGKNLAFLDHKDFLLA